MATQTLAPGSIYSSSNLSGAVTDIDEAVASPDANWLTASSNNVDSNLVVDFPTPTNTPGTGTGLQQFQIYARLTANGTACTYNVYLCETDGTRLNGGSAIATGSLTSTTGQTITATWDASLLGTADGSAVQCEFDVTKAGGAPSNRTTGEVGAIEWDAYYDSSRTVAAATEAVNLTASTATVTRNRPVTAATEAVALSANAATVARVHNVAAATEAVTITTNAATVTRHRPVACSTEAITLSANAASILRVWTADADHFTVDDNTNHTADGWHIDIPVANRDVNAVTEAISLTANAAGVSRDRAVSGATEAISVTGTGANINRMRLVAGSTAVITLTGTQGSVNRTRNVVAATEVITLTANAATIAAGANRNVNGSTEVVQLTANPATVSRARAVAGSTEIISLAARRAAVTRTTTKILPTVGGGSERRERVNPQAIEEDKLLMQIVEEFIKRAA